MSPPPIKLRTWCHINEFRKDGFRKVPFMIAVSDPLVLWGPSATLLKKYHQKDPKSVPFSPDDLLDYVRDGHVRIVARKNWISDKNFRNNHGWKPSRWVEGFDDEILNIWEEDMDLPELNRRVIDMPDETGTKWAKKAIKNKKLVEIVRKYILENKTPHGFKDRTDKMKSEEEKILEVLRNAKNHMEAKRESKSDVTIYPWDQTKMFLDESTKNQGRGLKIQKIEEEKAIRLIGGMIKVMERIEAFPKVEHLNEFLRKGYRTEMLQWLSEACRDRSVLNSIDPQLALEIYLRASMEKGLLRKEKKDFIIPKTWIKRGISGSGMVFSAASVFLGSHDLMSWTGLALGLIPGFNLLERVDVLPLSKTTYNGPRWPFICTTGKAPHWNQYLKIMSKLRYDVKKIS